MNHTENHISENLRMLRSRCKWSLEEVAERVEVSRQAVAKWESGESVPDVCNCMALAELYGVSLDDLVGYMDSEFGLGVPPRGKHVFGTVTVGERGQVVIPKKARELFAICPGDSLMVLGDENLGNRGIALVDPKLFLAQAEELARVADRKGSADI